MKKIYISFLLNTQKDSAKIEIKKIIDEAVEEELRKASLTGTNIQSSFDEFKLNYEIIINNKLWRDLVFKLILFAQGIAREWICSGSIKDEFSFWSNEPRLSGIEAINLSCTKRTCILDVPEERRS